MEYVYLNALGDTDTGVFTTGEDPKSGLILWLLFVLMSFILAVHLLNMLIAIMGETFASNKEDEKPNRVREHLRFILYNWPLDPLKDQKESGQINYLISAMLKDDFKN